MTLALAAPEAAELAAGGEATGGVKAASGKHAKRTSHKAKETPVAPHRAQGARHAADTSGGGHRAPETPAPKESKKSSKGFDTDPFKKIGFKSPKSVTRYRQMLVAEIIIGSIIILLEPSANDSNTTFTQAVETLAAFLIVFFILSVMTSTGPSGARVSATLGFVIIISLMLRPKNVAVIKKIVPPGFRNARSTAVTPISGTENAIATVPVRYAGNQGNPVGQPGGVYYA